jgi:glycosyltransferase involved in cell wall biosynthesis
MLPSMRSLRIAFVNQPSLSSYPPPTSSLEIWTYEVARQLAIEHELHVVGGRGARSLRRDVFSHQGVRYHLLPTTVDALIKGIASRLPIKRSPTRPLVASGLHYFVWANLAALKLRRLKPDVIHIHNQFSFVRPIRRLNPKARIVLHMQSEWLSQIDRKEVDAAIRATDAVVACSRHVLERAQARYGSRIRVAAVVPNGVDLEGFYPADETVPQSPERLKTIIFVGRVSPEKGCHTLVDAFCRLAKDDPNLQLRLIGPIGALPAEYIIKVSPEPFVRELLRYYADDPRGYWGQVLSSVPVELRDRIEATGPLPRNEVARAIREADILANPSLSETFGMALVEAMASGVPVVATTVGGMPEVIVDGVTGSLVPPDDPEALADALKGLLNDSRRRREFGSAGRARAVNWFSWAEVAASTLNLYTSLKRSEETSRIPLPTALVTEPTNDGDTK